MKLFFRKFGNSEKNIIILHGFLGQSDHWIPIAKKLSDNYTVFLPDQRNHGQSPWSDNFDYEVLAHDLKNFIQENNIEKPTLVGHSMGGKVAMQFVMLYPEIPISSMIIVDILPINYTPNPEMKRMMDVAYETDLSQFSYRSEILAFLKERNIHRRFIKLILKNIIHKKGKYQWKINMKGMHNSFEMVFSGFSKSPHYNKPILIIKGDNSDLINQEIFEQTKVSFPQARLHTIKDAGHWVHLEQEEALIKAIRDEIIRFT